MATSGLINIGGGSSTPMTGATALLDGESGAAPTPLAGQEGYLLSGAGTWVESPTTQALSNVSLTMSNPNGAIGTATTTIGSGYNVANLSAVALDVRYDPSGIVNTGNNSFTIQTTGTYEIIWGGIVNATNPTTYLRKNGARVGGIINIDSNNTASSFVYLAPLVAGDKLEIEIVANLGSMSVTLKQLPTAVAPVVNTIAEYGENTGIVNNQATASATFVDVSGGSFTLPSAGVWEVEYNIISSGTGAGNRCRYQIVKASDSSVVANSSAGFVYPANAYLEHVSQTSFITTTGSEVYKLQFLSAGGTLTITNANSGDGGNSKITWNKIAGQLPSTGQTVDYISLVGETGDSFSTAPSFTLTSDIFPVITSVAPTTARLPFTTQTSGGTMTVANSGNMTVGANNVTVVKTAVYSINASVLTARTATSNYSIQLIKNGTTVLSTSNGISGTSTTRDTQSINWAGSLNQGDTIDIRVKDGSATSIGVARYSLLINQLGSSNAIVTDNVALFGEQALTPTTIGNATVDIINGSFTLPSAGTWEVEYFGNISLNAGNISGGLLIADTTNVEVANSRSVTGAGASGGGNENAMVSNKVRIITTAPTTYKIRGIGNAANIALSTGLAIGGVGNKVSWNLIAGTVPSTGQSVDYVNARLTADTLVATSAAIPYVTQAGNIPNAGGVFTLTAGKTYRLTAMVAYAGTENATGFLCRWRDITNNATLGADGAIFSLNINSAGSPSSVIEAIVTPSTNIQVRLEQTSGSSKTFYGLASSSGQNWATIVQLGSSNVIAGLYPGTWGTYTPTITAVTTNPTKPTSGIVIDTAKYIIEGKKLTVNYTFWIGTAVGVNAGSGTYKFSLPPSITIDTSAITTIDSVDPTLASPNIANMIGIAALNRGSQAGLNSRLPGYVYAADANTVAASYVNGTIGTNNMFDSAAGNAGLQSGIGWTMQFTVPIL